MVAQNAISVNEALRHFEYSENGHIAFIEYRFVNKSIAFLHTIVPESIAGKGVAAALTVFAFNYAKENNMPVIVRCAYIAHYLKHHPELLTQLDPEFQFNT